MKENNNLPDYTEDLFLVLDRNKKPMEVFEAVVRLSNNKSRDVRAIAAQGCSHVALGKAGWLVDWIEREKSSEVRGWLYLALGTKFRKQARQYLRNVYQTSATRDAHEKLFLLSGLSAAFSSRFYLLKLMENIFSRSSKVSKQAAILCRMLVDEDDDRTLKFIDILERSAGHRDPSMPDDD
jgi:hypothetical protein